MIKRNTVQRLLVDRRHALLACLSVCRYLLRTLFTIGSEKQRRPCKGRGGDKGSQ